MRKRDDQLAVWLLVGLLAVDRVLGALKSRGVDLQRIGRQVDDLHDWHDETDADGVKIWYVRRSLEDALHSLSENISLETKLLDRIDRRLERIEHKVENK